MGREKERYSRLVEQMRVNEEESKGVVDRL